MDYEKLAEFAGSDLDKSICAAMAQEGSQRKAAQKIGMAQSYLCERLKKLKMYAETRGYAPECGINDMPPHSQLLSGVSTLYDADGNVTARWVKLKADQEAMLESAKAMIAEMTRAVDPVQPVKQNTIITEPDLLNFYVLTDAHLGMYAHHEEGGDNWDIKIAEGTINSSFDYLIDSTPYADTAVLLNLGDLLHSDGVFPVTPTSHHVLDQDSRQHRVIKTAIRVIKATMEKLLKWHKKVILINAQGNHDLSSALWMQASFDVLYENEPRADVVVSPLPYYAMQHGNCLLAATHGHKKRGRELADLITGQFRHLIGGTTHTYIHTGHLHQQEIVETPTSTIEQHPTLAARDSHTSHGGWLSKRAMQAIVYHKKHLEISRCTFRPQRATQS